MPPELRAALAAARAAAQKSVSFGLVRSEGALGEAMTYAMQGGKGLRGFLVMEGARLHGVDADASAPVAGAIEALHAYSLVHDDLPCMDDDDLRRGQPTVHRKWDEATAVLAGDALQALAFELVNYASVADSAKLTLLHSLAMASGARGMVGGQAMDIAAETAKDPLTLPQIEALQAWKTGALIRWAAEAGPTMAQDEAGCLAMTNYGSAIGLAFQIADDILDVEGDVTAVGKAVGKDADAGKATFVSLLGLDAAKARAQELVTEAQDALSSYGEDADLLRKLAQFVITRDR